MTIERNSHESLAMDLLRFPLACLIVLLHTGVSCGPENIVYYISNYIAHPIVSVAVPAFYFLSGYLFFIGREKFGWNIYIEKLRKKVKTLLVPYLIWNVIAYILNVGYSYAKTHTIGDVMPWELYRILWANGDGITEMSFFGYQYTVVASPAAGVLWFMRDLMMMMICSIILYPIIKNLKYWIFPILYIINILRIGVPFPGFSLAAITFFSIGAFFSIHGINIFKFLKGKICYLLWPLLIIIQTVLTEIGYHPEISWIGVLSLSSSVAFMFAVAYKSAESFGKFKQVLCKWGETSFFIYAFHGLIIVWLINKDVGYMLEDIPTFGPLLNYLYLFFIRIIECLIVFYVMKRYVPHLLNTLVGGRLK